MLAQETKLRCCPSATSREKLNPTDIDLTRVKPGTGIELLRSYLQYAETGGKSLGDGALTSVALNDFEQDIFDSLEAAGKDRNLKLVPQVGCSGYRIDMAAVHPERPGEYVLAIECDGASYHSAQTARDRDRLRQQHLKKLGWRFHRIWSTDWFHSRSQEIKRALDAYSEAVKASDNAMAHTEILDVDPPARPIQRGLRPSIPHYSSITKYRLEEIIAVIHWIESDGQLRSDEQLMVELLPLLGFTRRRSRIEAVLRSAISRSRQ